MDNSEGLLLAIGTLFALVGLVGAMAGGLAAWLVGMSIVGGVALGAVICVAGLIIWMRVS